MSPLDEPGTGERPGRRKRVRALIGLVAVAAIAAVAAVIVALWIGASEQVIAVDDGAASIAIADDGTVYVANARGDTVSAIANGEVVGTVALDDAVGPADDTPSSPARYWAGIAVGADGTVYVAHESGVSMITDLRVTGTIPFPPSARPYDVVTGPEGALYVTHRNGAVSVIADGEVTGTIPQGEAPLRSEMGLGDPDLRLRVEDPSIHSGVWEAGTLRLGDRSFDIEAGEGGTIDAAVGPDGSVYVIHGNGAVSVITDGEIVSAFEAEGGFDQQSIAAGAGGTAYIANGKAGTVSVVADGEIRETIAVGASADGMAVGPDGAVYVTDSSEDTVSVMVDGEISETIEAGSRPVDVAVAPDGTVYVVNFTDSSVSVFERDA